jgi:DNA transposition AAA+ family ATPase
MTLHLQYTHDQIEKIRKEGFIYQCSCPSQVAQQVMTLRELYNYEAECLKDETDPTQKTHELIAEAAQKAHDVMQQCLHDILILEQWDLETLAMPENLRQRLEKMMDDA